MKCPKCEKESSSDHECHFCGVVFDKFQKRVQPAAARDSSIPLKKDRAETFPPKPTRAQRRPEQYPEPGVRRTRNIKTLLVLRRLIRMVLDTHFLFLLSLACFFIYASLSFAGSVVKVPMYLQVNLFLVAFIFVGVFRMDWQGLRRDLSVDEGAVRLAVETDEDYNRALLNDRRENYTEAVELYEKVLVHDVTNIQARFNLARIYIGKLGDRNSGLPHLQMLEKTAPKGHPYYDYAVDELRNMQLQGDQTKLNKSRK